MRHCLSLMYNGSLLFLWREKKIINIFTCRVEERTICEQDRAPSEKNLSGGERDPLHTPSYEGLSLEGLFPF